MADFDISPGMQRSRTLEYSNAKGEPGTVEAPPTWTLSEDALANMAVDPDGMRGTIAHNGSIGDVVVTSEADGDIGLGVNLIVVSDTFHMKAPFGAVGGRSSVGAEEPIPAP